MLLNIINIYPSHLCRIIQGGPEQPQNPCWPEGRGSAAERSQLARLAAILRTQSPRPQRQAILERHRCCQQGLQLRTLCWLGRSLWGTAAQSGSFLTQSPFLPSLPQISGHHHHMEAPPPSLSKINLSHFQLHLDVPSLRTWGCVHDHCSELQNKVVSV